SPDSTKLWKTFLADGSAEVRAEATRALPALGREALPQLAKLAKASNAETERAAVEGLATLALKFGSSAVGPLEQAAAKSPRATTRKAAFDALARLAVEKPSLVAGVLGRLGHDKSPDVRAEALAALSGAIGGEKTARDAVGALRNFARDPDAGVRRRAAA